MRERLAKLICVKTFVTLAVTLVFVILALRLDIPSDTTMEVVTMVIIFYFGAQSGKDGSKNDKTG